jgi:hypothetical protein
MTKSEIRSLSRQADRAAVRSSGRPAWQQELAARAASHAGTDAEPSVNVVVIKEVKRVLSGAEDLNEDDDA